MSEKHTHAKLSATRQAKHFLLSGVAGSISYTVVYPLETLKTRTQVQSEVQQGGASPWKILKQMRQTEGIRGFYRGIFAALFHPLICTASRFGLYFMFEDMRKRKTGRKVLSFLEKSYLSIAAGAFGEILVIPFDVVYVRFQAEYGLPKHLRAGYKGIFNAVRRIIAEEGPLALWKGTVPSIIKCMAVNFGMLTPYYECKERLSKYLGNTKTNYLLAAAIAGIGASVITLPVDNVKVKLQKGKGSDVYKGAWDCVKKTYRNEGIRGYWAGMLPFYCFFAPHVMLTLLINDIFRINAQLCHC